MIFSYESMIPSKVPFKLLTYLSSDVCNVIVTNVIPAAPFPTGGSRVNTVRKCCGFRALVVIPLESGPSLGTVDDAT